MKKLCFGMTLAALTSFSLKAENKPKVARQQEEIKKSGAESQKINSLLFFNTVDHPITINYSYNVDPEKTTGDTFPSKRGVGRNKSALLTLPSQKGVLHTPPVPLNVPQNLPLRIAWLYKNKQGQPQEHTLDIMVAPHSTAASIDSVLNEAGTIFVNFSWDPTYGGGSPMMLAQMVSPSYAAQIVSPAEAATTVTNITVTNKTGAEVKQFDASFNVDAARTSGNEFPKIQGEGRNRLPALTNIADDATVSLSMVTKSFPQGLKIPQNLPIRLTWHLPDGSKKSKDIVMKGSDDQASLNNVLNADGSIKVTLSWDIPHNDPEKMQPVITVASKK